MRVSIGVIAVALILMLPICLVGCTDTNGGSPPSEELQLLSHSMTVHEFTGGMPESTAMVRGRVKNTSNSNISFASIAVDFYDADRNLIDSSSAIRQNLGPGQVWDFNVQITGPDAWKSVDYDIMPSVKR